MATAGVVLSIISLALAILSLCIALVCSIFIIDTFNLLKTHYCGNIVGSFLTTRTVLYVTLYYVYGTYNCNVRSNGFNRCSCRYLCGRLIGKGIIKPRYYLLNYLEQLGLCGTKSFISAIEPMIIAGKDDLMNNKELFMHLLPGLYLLWRLVGLLIFIYCKNIISDFKLISIITLLSFTLLED